MSHARYSFLFVGPLPDLKHLIGHVSVPSTLMYIYNATKRVGVVHGSGISSGTLTLRSQYLATSKSI
ncbi:hypothetical protein DTO280E4_1775 [Paecilomyces variotii]|nr:hypothetical protein DTO207G8_7504 [Paecilomyces variotii]KAJ9364529.1 hypothetical protein DTO280E4_1775 [Paecilomyces variotii]KAJ9378059.1 hypothetical protein DTO063F5_7946 [Paecilomyces variotii]